VGQAFLDTLAHAFGKDFDDETRNAWAAAYALMAALMKMGAREMDEPAKAAA
jgi:hemoglobin-like flavoprotein